MSEKKEFKGITRNRCDFQGKIVAEPTYFAVDGGEGSIFKIRTFVPEFQANGQRVDVQIDVPIINMNPQRTANVIKKYATVGKEVDIGAYYKTWKDAAGADQSGLIMTFIQLGHGPYVPKENKPNIPSLPIG